jgi:hypothetical protein
VPIAFQNERKRKKGTLEKGKTKEHMKTPDEHHKTPRPTRMQSMSSRAEREKGHHGKI